VIKASPYAFVAPLTSLWFPYQKDRTGLSLIWYHPVKVKTEDLCGDLRVAVPHSDRGRWQTDRHPFSTEPVPGL